MWMLILVFAVSASATFPPNTTVPSPSHHFGINEVIGVSVVLAVFMAIVIGLIVYVYVRKCMGRHQYEPITTDV